MGGGRWHEILHVRQRWGIGVGESKEGEEKVCAHCPVHPVKLREEVAWRKGATRRSP